MALLRIDYHSKVLELETYINVVIPDGIELSSSPVVFLLHGLSGNAENWIRYTSAERYAMDHGVVLVMPEVGRSYYCDMEQGLDYFTYVTEEIPLFLKRTFHFSDNYYVFGNSMGGYGALKCYFKRRDLFLGCGAFSAVADIRYRWDTVHKKDMSPVMAYPKDEDDIYCLVEKETKDTNLFITCGLEDQRIDMNRKLVALLEKKGFSTKVDFRHGIHDWVYWDKALKDALNYFFP
ncbi:MAG: prolyl oligopeptidase family serine peptidase [Spirochaetales bacterium]|nr:prolyl oligopeptidase family serine peptidase [Candidatus Physcosoma equi]